MKFIKNKLIQKMLLAVVCLALGILIFPKETPPSVTVELEVGGYDVIVNDQVIGQSTTEIDLNDLANVIESSVMEKLGYLPEEPIKIELQELFVDVIETEDINSLAIEAYISTLDNIKEQVLELNIGDTKVIVKDIEEVKSVLESSVSSLMTKDYVVDINVEMVESGVEINFVETVADDCKDSLNSIEVIEPISIEPRLAFNEEVLPVEEAVNIITKLNEKPQTYEVKSGDVPSIIAENFEINLTKLYQLNPGLEDKASRLQIGESLVVTVQEAEMSIKTSETVVSEVAIRKGYTYKNDASLYVGTNKTTFSGSDGVKEVVYNVEKVDGVEVSRTVLEEIIVNVPVDAVISTGTKALPDKGSIGTFISPLADYYLTSEFGPRWNSQHRGIDMAANYGSSVRASDGGVVSYSGWYSSYGYLVEIDHGNGIKTRYGHNSKLLVSKGDIVSQYQQIALVGSTGNSTGPHVHFEIMIDNTPVDPYLYLE
jgi:murein DD-endopeptidase MepM/ murein hydrolase activator NlpD